MNDLDRALVLIEAGEPVPIDLAARLLEQGVHVEQLIETHSP